MTIKVDKKEGGPVTYPAIAKSPPGWIEEAIVESIDWGEFNSEDVHKDPISVVLSADIRIRKNENSVTRKRTLHLRIKIS